MIPDQVYDRRHIIVRFYSDKKHFYLLDEKSAVTWLLHQVKEIIPEDAVLLGRVDLTKLYRTLKKVDALTGKIAEIAFDEVEVTEEDVAYYLDKLKFHIQEVKRYADLIPKPPEKLSLGTRIKNKWQSFVTSLKNLRLAHGKLEDMQ